MKPVLGLRKSWQEPMHLDAAAERVFPLLCPVLEYDWIEDWRCQLIYTASGVAEDGCIFRTNRAPDGPMTWIVTRYEAPWRIEFAAFVPGSHIMRLKLELSPTGAGTTVLWTREFTATDRAGETWLAERTDAEYRCMMERIEQMLKYYLRTGTMLRFAPAQLQAVE